MSDSTAVTAVTADTQHISLSEAQEQEPTKITMEAITAQGNKIRLVDSDAGTGASPLDLYCYVKCADNENPTVKACRGVVMSGGKLVLQTFGYTPEFLVSARDSIQEYIGDSLNEYRVFDSHEGSLLRVFYAGNKWYVSTHRKLDAYRSKWASRESFGEIFENALAAEYAENEDLRGRVGVIEPGQSASADEGTPARRLQKAFFGTLDKDKCYCFLVRNTSENRIVCQPPERPTLYHVGTFDKLGGFELDRDVGVPRPLENKFTSLDEALNYAKELNPDELQGVILFSGAKHVKILTDEYSKLFSVRGNEPSVKYRYLQVRMNNSTTDLLYQLYPRYTEIFEDYENKLYAIAQGIYSAYVQRFIKKQYVTVPKEEYQVMRACHSWHLEDRGKNRISQRKVVEKLNEQTPTNLNKMIRHYTTQSEEDKKTGTVPGRYPRTQDDRNSAPNSAPNAVSPPLPSGRASTA